MSINSSISWSKINDYLVEAGSSANTDEFIGRTLHNIGRIIPFDINGLFVTVDTTGKLSSWQSVIEYEKWVQIFINRYWHFMPDVRREMVISADWNSYRNNEFVNDFLKPQGIRYSIGVFNIGSTASHTASFALFRSGNYRQFSETEQTTCSILQTHLTNLFSLLSKLNRPEKETFYFAELIRDCKLLSKREVEVAVLLCQRLTIPEIATKLLISSRTVEFHIINIYEKMKVRSRRELLIKLVETKE
jgi:DNA-binding CsgD family transcriptional regulator